MLPNQPHSPSRRRLAKGALASSVVLTSLTVKDALATGRVVRCSGNMSTTHASHQPGDTNCSAGFSNSHWRNNVYTSTNARQIPSFFGAFVGKGVNRSARRAATADGKGWSPLTCHQLLWGSDIDPKIRDVDFVVKALCVYLNAEEPGYYIGVKDVENLYVSVTTGTSWSRQASSKSIFSTASADADQVWGPEESRQHIEILYRA